MTAYRSINRHQLFDQELLSSAPALFDCDDEDIAVYYARTPHIVPCEYQLTLLKYRLASISTLPMPTPRGQTFRIGYFYKITYGDQNSTL